MAGKRAYIVIAAYLLVLSVTPLIASFLGGGGWIGFDMGAYYYRNEHLEVRLAGLPEGVGKPRIYVYAPNSSYMPVLILDVNDRESTVEGYSLFYDAIDVKITALNTTLTIAYVFEDFNLTKTIIAADTTVTINYQATKTVKYKIVVHGRNYTSINGLHLRDYVNKTLKLEKIEGVSFKFHSKPVGAGSVYLNFSSPVNVEVEEEVKGVTIIIVTWEGDRLSMSVRGYVEPHKLSPVTSTLSSLLNHRVTPILLPLITLVLIFVGWTVWRRL
ncbi:MAG: hypothetical protein P3X22_005130 [Thermoprotei archaeon]|nr:hypothetical protein [Thermoprotei archaeon]